MYNSLLRFLANPKPSPDSSQSVWSCDAGYWFGQLKFRFNNRSISSRHGGFFVRHVRSLYSSVILAKLRSGRNNKKRYNGYSMPIYPLMSLSNHKKASAHLATHDPHLADVIAVVGLCTISPHTNYYQDLVRSIIGQQLSVKAAASINKRFCDLFGDTFPTPQQILAKDLETLRAVGLSRPKVAYIQDLAQHVVDGRLSFEGLDAMSNQQVIDTLTAVKGVGEWTAHMFLMFCMGRTDVLAWGDLGIRNGIKKLYGLEDNPTPDDIRMLAQRYQWHPYESIACWYIWQSLDNEPK